jgi:hypothetical protein
MISDFVTLHVRRIAMVNAPMNAGGQPARIVFNKQSRFSRTLLTIIVLI